MSPTPNELYVEEAGTPEGPPALLLHGFMSSALQWEPNRERLGAELRLLLAEQPGHGRSPGPDDPNAYQADTVLDQIEHIRASRGIDRWWLIGQSLGGAILIRYALRHPDRVHGLVFTNSRAVFAIPRRRSETADAEPRRVRSAEPTREDVRAFPYHPRNAKWLPADLKARMAAAADAMPLCVFKHLGSRGPWHSTDDLHMLEVPTLLINGTYEKAFQPAVQQARDAISDLQVVNLEGGHAVNIDQAEAFDRAVLDFIGQRGPKR